MPSSEFAFEAIGAPWRITTPDSLGEDTVSAILARIEDFDHTYSRFRADSLVTKISREAGRWTLPADAAPLLSTYRALYEGTSGAVTPLVGARLENLGYDADYSLVPHAEPGPGAPASAAAVLRAVAATAASVVGASAPVAGF